MGGPFCQLLRPQAPIQDAEGGDATLLLNLQKNRRLSGAEKDRKIYENTPNVWPNLTFWSESVSFLIQSSLIFQPIWTVIIAFSELFMAFFGKQIPQGYTVANTSTHVHRWHDCNAWWLLGSSPCGDSASLRQTSIVVPATQKCTAVSLQTFANNLHEPLNVSSELSFDFWNVSSNSDLRASNFRKSRAKASTSRWHEVGYWGAVPQRDHPFTMTS